ncbi:MAG TPA: hypothetical protein PK441_13260 [Burkholderiaceae bacterium]|nr:hypothetical protein [Burkholderiaceae bacterium]
MIAWLRRVLRHPHVHAWTDTRMNRWAITTEQRCACGAARHLSDCWDVFPITAPVNWHDGKHPMAKDA